eukprot:2901664-Pyramimonas_sp.AAC.1
MGCERAGASSMIARGAIERAAKIRPPAAKAGGKLIASTFEPQRLRREQQLSVALASAQERVSVVVAEKQGRRLSASTGTSEQAE